MMMSCNGCSEGTLHTVEKFLPKMCVGAYAVDLLVEELCEFIFEFLSIR